MVPTCLKYFFVFLVVASHSNGQYGGDPCITPVGIQGNCLPVRSCPSMMTALLTVQRPLSDTAREQLEAYYCAADFKVCCPRVPIVIKELANRTDPDASEPGQISSDVDMTKHRNYRLLPSDCGYLDVAGTRIINGQDAGRDYPWMTLLSFRGPDNRGAFDCAGSIINNRYILTAAHCLVDRSRLLGVRVGEYNITNKGVDCFGKGNEIDCNYPTQDLAIEEIISHPNYEQKQQINDIALLRVTPITFNDKNIKPVCLPRVKKSEFNPESVEVSGWGLTKSLGRKSNILQMAFLKVVTPSKCQPFYQNLTVIDDSRICAGGLVTKNDSNACSGDSGGPLQVQERIPGVGYKYVQHGIVSFGVRQCNYPAVFTKVDFYIKWILDNMKP
ncbi:CLIP domain-containing serine protease B10-like isoform X1 [Diabrotica virgifera virgifera]|uniref:CLIP domain-containing serine protease n=1 Tax=Diabrotica virgifera virgifera TaxID=50390 RepID=A0A6P7FLK4_DIAVI|nr:CLIP domain-containing serine protease B10-like isoform X1 [Diabrotica virgifera virgifera]